MDHKDTPLLSVITLTYNNQHYLPETIGSVLTQSYPNIEYIISDDGSADFNVGYWESYIREHYPQFSGRLVVRGNIINSGTVNHGNIAIGFANGKYIKFMSAGDLFANSGSAARLTEEMENNGWQIANSISAVYDEKLKKRRDYYPARKNLLRMGNMTAEMQFQTLIRYNAVGGSGVIISKELFMEIGGFDEAYRLTEDWPMWLKLTRGGIKIESIDVVSATYRLGGVSGAGAKDPILLKDFILIMEREILAYRELFSRRQWRGLQIQYTKALRWDGFSTPEKLWFLVRHIGYFSRRKLLRTLKL